MLEIIEYREDLASAIAELETECFSEPWSENAIIEAAKYGTLFFAAEDNGKILGYLGVKPVLGEGFISNVAVTKSARGSGVGSMLVGKMLQRAKKINLESVTLEVRVSNTPAIALYEKFGFKTVGIRPRFYSHPTEDAKIMTVTFK